MHRSTGRGDPGPHRPSDGELNLWLRVLRTAILPHAPLLVELPGRPHPCPSISSAARSVSYEGLDVVVVCSPHAAVSGVYRVTRGDLSHHGIKGVGVDLPTDDGSVGALSEAWGRPILEDAVDHGVIVPLVISAVPPAMPVIAVGIQGWTGPTESDPSEAIADGAALADALVEVAGERRVGFIASAHGSASASPRAPLTERPEGHQLDTEIVRALADSPASVADIPTTLWRDAGGCGAGPFATLARLAPPRPSMIAFDAPFGVAYVVTSFT